MPPTLNIPLELIEHRYRDYLQSQLPAALDDVEAFWDAQADPLPLPDIAQWHTGDLSPGSVFLIIQKLPAVTIEAINLSPLSEMGTALVDKMVVTVYTRGSTPDKANKLTHRYAAAIAKVIIEGQPSGEGIKQVLQPSVDVSEIIDVDDANFLKAAKISVALRVTAVLG
jgi:hypothetical protein